MPLFGLLFLSGVLYGFNSVDLLSLNIWNWLFTGLLVSAGIFVFLYLYEKRLISVLFFISGMLCGILAGVKIADSTEVLPVTRGAYVELDREITGFPVLAEYNPDSDEYQHEKTYQVKSSHLLIVSPYAENLYRGQTVLARGRLYSYTNSGGVFGTLYLNEYLTGDEEAAIAESLSLEWNEPEESLSSLVILSEGPFVFKRTAGLRAFIRNKILLVESEVIRDLLFSFMLGNREFLSFTTWKSFQMTGISHILAISGMHVGILSFGLVWLLTLRMKEKHAYIIASMAVVFYVVIAGFPPSLMRAGLMFLIFNIMKISGRNVDFIETLLFSAMLLLIIDPLLIDNAGFWLSYTATAGIAILSEPLSDTLRLGGKTGQVLSATLAANIATMPLIIYYFKGFSLVSPLTNICISIFFSVLVMCLFVEFIFVLAGLSFPIWEGVIDNLWWAIRKIAEVFSMPRYSYIETKEFSPMVILTGYLFIIFIFFIVPRLRYRRYCRELKLRFPLRIK